MPIFIQTAGCMFIDSVYDTDGNVLTKNTVRMTLIRHYHEPLNDL